MVSSNGPSNVGLITGFCSLSLNTRTPRPLHCSNALSVTSSPHCPSWDILFTWFYSKSSKGFFFRRIRNPVSLRIRSAAYNKWSDFTFRLRTWKPSCMTVPTTYPLSMKARMAQSMHLRSSLPSKYDNALLIYHWNTMCYTLVGTTSCT